MKALDFAVSKILPPDLRQSEYDLSKKGMGVLMAQVASKYPEQYATITKKLGDLGRKAAWFSGYTAGESDTQPVIDVDSLLERMDAELDALRKEDLSPEEFDDARSDIHMRYSDMIEKETMRQAMRSDNAFAKAVSSGARGNAAHVKAILSSPALYADAKGRLIPLFVRNSFAKGMRPAELLAGTYGARSAVVSTKKCLMRGTMVRMADGSRKAIESIVPGDVVMGVDRNGKLEPAVVTRCYDQGLQDCWEWRLRVGYGRSRQIITLSATSEHRVLATSLCSYSRLLSAKKRGAAVDPTPYYHEKKIIPIGAGEVMQAAVLPTAPATFAGTGRRQDFAMILGLLAGDGCLAASRQRRGVRLYFSCADASLKEDLSPYLQSLGLKITKCSDLNYDHEIVQIAYDRSAHATLRTRRGTQGFTDSLRAPVKEAVMASGMWGKMAHEKTLPIDFYQWDTYSVESYLAGLFASDGCFTVRKSGTTTVGIYLTSEVLVRQLSEVLLWRYGIAQAAFIRRIDDNVVNGAKQPRKHPLFGFQFGSLCELKKLESVFSMMPGAKGVKARNALAKIEKQGNPFTKAYIARGDHLGMVPCYDIEVDNQDHLFMLASGVVVSNSTAKGGDFLKILTQNTSQFNVTERDCGTDNGLDMPVMDSSLLGRVLARPAAGLSAGTVIDRRVLGVIRKQEAPVIVRSAMTCRARHGLCAHCVGVQADGKFPRIGESIGVTAGDAIGEPIVQGSLNCLAEGTLVRMADFSIRRIQDVRPGEMVLGADVHGDTFPVKVLALHDQGVQPVQVYTYKMGQTNERISVVCTKDHPILQTTYYTGCKEGCKEEEFNYTPRKLPAGRGPGQPSAVLPRSCKVTDGVREPLAKIIGYYLGDGIRWQAAPTSGKQHAITVSCACTATVADLNSYLSDHGLRLTKCQRSHDWRIAGFSRASRGHALKDAIKRLGLSDVYCHEKQVPDEVWSWCDSSVADLIAGFISADGSVYKAGATVGVSFASTSRAMLQGLRDLLRVRFGVYSCPTTRTAAAGKNSYTHDMWAFTITRRDQVRRLAALVAGLIPGDKGAKLNDFLRNAPPSHYENQPFFKAGRCAVTDAGETHCWDLSVDHPDELFVLANSLIVKNTKHNSGMAKSKKSFSGFEYISQFVQVPDEFKDRAAVAEHDGVVERIDDAPQGGKLITIAGKQHLALPGFDVLVKPGDTVEAGDILSDGLASPADIVRLRGLGEGRKYYLDRLSQILADSGNPPDRRNMEIIARATVDNFVVEDPEEDDPWFPDDDVREQELMASFKPRPDSSAQDAESAVGAYLQKPVLHYTVGTRITPKIAKHMKSVGVGNVLASRTEPGFKARMPRLRVASHSGRDWLQGMGTSYLSSQMRESLERGDETNIRENTHFGPRLAYGVDAGAGGFGENIERTGMF